MEVPRWDLSDKLQIWVPRSRKCWRTEGSAEDKNTRQARQASWAGLGVRRGAWKLALALAVAVAVACEPLCHLPDCQAPTRQLRRGTSVSMATEQRIPGKEKETGEIKSVPETKIANS